MAETMTRVDIRTHVRSYFDAEDEDMPDVLIDRWISEGWGKIVRFRSNWPGFNSTVQLVVIAGTAEYTNPLKDIESIEGPERYLVQLDAAHAERRFIRGGVADPAGPPVAFSVYGGKVRLWPVPSVNRTYTIRGQRAAINPLVGAAAAAIDLPAEAATEMLLDWVVSRAATREAEYETAEAYLEAFTQGMQLLAKDETDSAAFSPIVLNSMPSSNQGMGTYLPDRLRFADGWEG